MSDRDVPKSRLGRLARLAGAGARTATQLIRGGDATLTAGKAASVLGELRGLASKVGQMASYVDGLIPEEHRETYERSMSRLQSATATSPYEAIAARIEAELGQPVDALYAQLDPTPIASASIGQVHRALLHDGRGVAVKVQHPGVAEALEADLRNAGLVEMALSSFGMRRFESKRMLEELRERFREELDYALEAERQRAFAALHRDDATIRIPAVIDELSTARVLTTEFFPGQSFDAACAAPEDQRRQWCETLWRFVYKSNLIGGLFNADPHPGNYLFRPDGEVGFLDFGCVQPLTEHRRTRAAVLHSAAGRGDVPGFLDGARALLGLRGGRYEDAALDYVSACFRPLFESPFRITRSYSSDLVERFKAMTSEFRKPKKGVDDGFVPLEEGMLFINRLQFGFYSVLARLDAPADYAAVERGFLPDAH